MIGVTESVEFKKIIIDGEDEGKNLARIARYYRSSSISNEEFDPDTPTELPSVSADPSEMPTEPRILKSQDLAEKFDDDSIACNDEREALKSKPQSSTYNLPIKYEYPEMVQSMKAVYKEMIITSGLYLLNIISAVGIVLVNKIIYHHYKFSYGIILTLYHFILTSIGLYVLAGMDFFEVKPVNILKVLPLSISFCSYVVLTNLSLQYNSGTFYQILVAPTIALLQFLLFGIKTELSLLIPMGIMFAGVGIATLTELKPSLLGLSIAFSGILMTAIYQILVGTKQKQLGLSAIQLLYYQAPLSSLLLALVAPALTDLSEVFNFQYSRGLVIAIVSSAFCAFLLNLSMYLVLGRSNALTYNVIGLSKLFLVLFLNYWMFERKSKPNFVNLFGVFVAFSGVCSYSFIKFKLMIQEKTNLINKLQS